MHGSTTVFVKDKLKDPEKLCPRLSVNNYRDLWTSFSFVNEDETEPEDLGKTGHRNFDRKEQDPGV
jgi:hypothetical protein